MFAGIVAILTAIPGIGAIITGITGKMFDAKVALVQARIGGDKEVATKLVTAATTADHENTTRLGILASNKVLTLLLVAFAAPLVIFEWKVIVWDKVFGALTDGSTDAIGGQVADWATTIIGFIFGSATAMGLGKMWFGRNKAGE